VHEALLAQVLILSSTMWQGLHLVLPEHLALPFLQLAQRQLQLKRHEHY
jgi:hypothetical protein